MAKNYFTEIDKNKIRLAIFYAELHTSGEIRVHVDNWCWGNPVKKAIRIFQRLKMYETVDRNGVLIYVSIKHHKLAIIGDIGINEKVPDHFWDDERDLMIGFFKNQQYTEGLIKGIELVGLELKTLFPASAENKNELSNEISFGE
jgi:uncharacterized membrane protein